MEFVCVIVFLVLGTSSAAPQDLRSKMLTFPEGSKADFVSVDLNRTELRSFTVCMRSEVKYGGSEGQKGKAAECVFTDLVTRHNLFQLSTNSSGKPENNFLIYNEPERERYVMIYQNSSAAFNRKDYRLNEWQFVCASWASDHGLVTMWVHGRPSSRKFLSQSIMKGPLAVVIGKGSDSYWRQTFVGMISSLYLWDYELNQSQIQDYGLHSFYPHRTVLRWSNLDLQIHGRVLIQRRQIQL